MNVNSNFHLEYQFLSGSVVVKIAESDPLTTSPSQTEAQSISKEREREMSYGYGISAILTTEF